MDDQVDRMDNTSNGSPSDGRPLRGYERVRNAVEEFISSHDLKPGDRIPTEVEFCKLLGWSRPTITRALNDMAVDGILERVQGRGTFIAEQRPNLSYSIMVSTPWTEPGSYIESLFSGIRQEAARNSLSITYYSDAPVPSPEVMKERGLDGVLAVAPHLDDLSAIQRLHEAKIPVVGLAVRDRVGGLPVVCTDNYGGVYEAVKYLLGLGHKRIAYVSDALTSSDVFERLLGFQNAMADAGQHLDPAYLLMSASGISPTYFEYWFENLPAVPTAILFGIQLSVPVLRMLARKRIRIPEDISIVVTDDPEMEWGMDRTLACVHQPVFEMGRRGAEKLVGMIKGVDSGAQEVIPTEFRLKDSIAVPRETATGTKAS